MKKVFFTIFALIPFLIALFIFVTPDKAISENENRTLTGRKEIKLNISDSQFQQSLEEYLCDQFPMRERLKSYENKIRFALGQREIGDAYILKGGRLVQAITPSDIDADAAVSYAQKINSIAKDTGIDTYVLYVPSSCVALSKLLPNDAPVYDYDALSKQLQDTLINCEYIDVYPTLSASAGNYYRTDHHWSANGAYKSYTLWCQSHNISPLSKSELNIHTVSDDFYGTLYSKVLLNDIKAESLSAPDVGKNIKVTADGAKVSFYDNDALKTKDKYNYFQGGNHGVCEISNPDCKNGKTLIVLKDSFANSFVPYLTYHYEKIIMIDERYTFIDIASYVSEAKPDEILVLKEIIS